MSYRPVVEYSCGRCARKWYSDPPKEEQKGPVAPTVAVSYSEPGEEPIDISFDVLCEGCKNTVKNLVQSISKEIKGKSPARRKGGAKKKEEPRTPPSSSKAHPNRMP